QNVQVIDELRFKTGKEIEPRFGFHGEIRAVLERYYPEPQATGSQPQFTQEFSDGTMEFISSSEQQRNIEAMREIQAELLQKSKTTPAVQVVASTIQAAVRKSASDIHIEPQAGETSIRLRIDGILREHQQIP